MNLIKLSPRKIGCLLFGLCVSIALPYNPAQAHVVPQEELQKRVYLNLKQALLGVFTQGGRIRKEKKQLSPQQIQAIKKSCGSDEMESRLIFYTNSQKNAESTPVTIQNVSAASHPPMQAKIVVALNQASPVRIQSVKIMEYRGPQWNEVITDRFLDQFKSLTAESDFSAITSNQGPTLPVQSLARAVCQAVTAYHLLNADSTF